MIYAFGEFRLDTRRGELRRDGDPRHLEPQVYAVLCHLLENRDRLVTRVELLDRVWGGRYVTLATLDSRVQALRRALDDDGTAQRVIRTVRGRGFRFLPEVRVAEAVPATAGPSGATAAGDGARDRAVQHIRFCHAADAVRIAYALSGCGPVLVKPANWLTHLELDWDSPAWRHWLRELSVDFTLLRYDQRGCGLSDLDVAELSFAAWVRDLEAVVDAAGLDRFPLLGISQGCAVAIAYAARHPQRVTRLVLYGGYLRGRLHRGADPRQEEESRMLRELIRVGWGRDHPAFHQVFGALFLPAGSPQQQRWFTDLARTVPVDNALRIEELSHRIDVRVEATRLDVPTLVLHARHDAMCPFEEGRLLAATVPGARFVQLDSPNHILVEQEPAWHRFLAEVRQFLAPEGAAPTSG